MCGTHQFGQYQVIASFTCLECGSPKVEIDYKGQMKAFCPMCYYYDCEDMKEAIKTIAKGIRRIDKVVYGKDSA